MNTIQASRIRGQPRGIVDTLFDIQDEETDAGKGVIFTDDAINAQVFETVGAGRIKNNIICSNTSIGVQRKSSTHVIVAIQLLDVLHSYCVKSAVSLCLWKNIGNSGIKTSPVPYKQMYVAYVN